ncbi:hypothetical protein GmHk_10G029357 [Glycine max]|nr:hypothetical protein GmHk_10G029357 [Glycine max]
MQKLWKALTSTIEMQQCSIVFCDIRFLYHKPNDITNQNTPHFEINIVSERHYAMQNMSWCNS